jgi:hypothetical protein
MAFNRALLEQFAMHAERLSQQEPVFGASVSVNAICDAAGIPREDGRKVAEYLAELGWAKVVFTGEIPLTLTPQGYEEIAKLRRPKWRQWMDQHPITMNVFWMTTTAIVAGIIYTVITYYLLK